MLYYLSRESLYQPLNLWDVVLTPIYIIALSWIAKRHFNKNYPRNSPLRKYYMPALYVKLFGAVFISLIYHFYYKGGDTFNFYFHSRVINSSLSDSVITWIKLLFRVSPDTDPVLYTYVSHLWWYNDRSSYVVAVFGSIFGLLNGTSYLPISLIFAYLAFTGSWAMFKTFVKLYPAMAKQLAIAFLFIPSTFIWGSAMFKDTLCMFGLGWMTYGIFRIFIDNDRSIKNILIVGMSIYLISILKLYILMAFIPAISLWLLVTYSHKIPSKPLRFLVTILFMAINLSIFFFVFKYKSQGLDKFSLEEIAKTANTTRSWILYRSGDEGSGYDLGEIPPDIGGMVAKFPAAVVVTLFRPWVWEVKKPIVLLAALESSIFLFFTLLAFYKRGIGGTLKEIFTDPNILFFFIFSIIFAFAVGISTGNFGTLSRYKIPCVPFFAAFLLVLHHKIDVQIQASTKKQLNAKTKGFVRNIA